MQSRLEASSLGLDAAATSSGGEGALCQSHDGALGRQQHQAQGFVLWQPSHGTTVVSLPLRTADGVGGSSPDHSCLVP